MDKKILIRRVAPVVIVVAILLNVEECCALSKEKKEVKKAIGVEKEWKGYHCGYTKAARLIIKTEDRWKELWGKVHLLRVLQQELPKIDLKKKDGYRCFYGRAQKWGL